MTLAASSWLRGDVLEPCRSGLWRTVAAEALVLPDSEPSRKSVERVSML